MKVAKSYKIIFLVLAFVMSTMLALGMMKSPSVYADSQVSASKYFSLNGATAVFTDEGLNIEAKDEVNVSFKNNLIVNDLSMKMKLPEDFTTSISVSLSSFYVNGNPKNWDTNPTQTEFDKTIKNELLLNYKDTSKTVVNAILNGQEVSDIQVEDGFITIKFGIKDNYFTINDNDVASKYNADGEVYYKVKDVDGRAVSSAISIGFDQNDDVNDIAVGEFVLEYVDQKTSDASGDYKQSLKLEDGQTKLTSAKRQRVYLSESFYLRTEDGDYKLVVKATNEAYTLSYKACSVLGEGGYLCLVNPENIYNYDGIETSTSTPDTIRFEKNTTKFGVGIKEDGEPVLFEEFDVDKILDFDYEDKQVPVYVYDEIAYASFLNALKGEYTAENSQGQTTSAGLGTTLYVPSMKDLVFDNFDTYESLTEKVYYSNDKTSSSESQMSFKLNAIGDYLFFVTFKDSAGNQIEETDFIYEEDNIVKNGIYGEDDSVANYVGNFVFKFEIIDNADIIVNVPEVQGNGFKGVEYRASKFIIEADGCKDTYKLFYNSNVNASVDDANWIEIKAVNSVSEDEYENNGFSYSEVEKVNYNGELKFVPTRIGAYKIECTVTSTVSSRYATNSTIIKVDSKPNVVEVPSKWLENNIWSVVFLSVGTLSLIGIIILLCIKPKEQTDND